MTTQPTHPTSHPMEFQTQHTGSRWKPATLRAALSGRGYAAKTVKDYFNAICRAQDWMKGQGWTLDDAPSPVIAAYIDTLPQSRSSRNLTRSALVAYWEVTGREHAPVGAIRVPKMPRFKSRALTREDASKLARAANEWDRGGEGVAVLLGLYVGLRSFEIAKLRWDELTPELDEITFVGKWEVEATLPVHRLVARRLEWWRHFRVDGPTDGRTFPGDTYVFQGRYYGRKPHITSATVWTWVKRVAENVGVETSPHELRHTCLTEMNDRTGDLRAVQEFARHADPETTARYTRVTSEKLRGLSDALTY